jgi:hypothetical protein
MSNDFGIGQCRLIFNKTKIIYFIRKVIHSMASSEISDKRWNIIAGLVVIFLIIIILAFSGGLNAFIGKEYPYSMVLYEMNGSFVPQGNIVHLTEVDFNSFPKLASVIRDKNQKPTILNDGRRFYSIGLTNDEYSWFVTHYLPTKPNDNNGRFFEYLGIYYNYDVPVMH